MGAYDVLDYALYFSETLKDVLPTSDSFVDHVRRETAERLMGDGRLSITEIAFMLGFADVSGFRRMYKQWTGEAPSRGR